MAVLKQELWIGPDGLTGLCLAGPKGDRYRELLKPGSKLNQIIEGSSHFDVMTKYYEIMGWRKYSTPFPQDYESYPDEWLAIQESIK